MKRVTLGWACRQTATLGLAVFIGVGFYGIFHLLFASPPPPSITLHLANNTFYASGGDGWGAGSAVQVGEIQPNCGLLEVCPNEHFPVHVFTGKTKDDRPRVCVSGRYVIERDINNGGRGINAVVVDPRRMQAVMAERFDTYAVDSTDLEAFLKKIQPGDILVILTFDEASRNLSPPARNLLADLGSSQIQNLQFRGQWYMITQKGLDGFSPYETLRAAKAGLWNPIDERLCVPRQLKGRPILPDPPVLQNPERQKFCSVRPTVADFCSVDQRDTPLRPAILTNRQLVGSAIFSTPIMVIAGEESAGDLSGLALTLETLLGQPGIQPRQVVVVYDPRNSSDVPNLCKLFKFSAKPIVAPKFTGKLEYYELMKAVFEVGHTLFPASTYITIIEAGLLLAPDFLGYTASLLPLLHDPSILAISAWNPNGYMNSSSRSDLAYRIDEFPGQAFTMRMVTYLKELKNYMKECCNRRGWDGWLEEGRLEREILVPDVSRVLLRPTASELQPKTQVIEALFHRLRATNLDSNAVIQEADALTSHRYETHLTTLINSSLILTPNREEVLRCAGGGQEGGLHHLTQLQQHPFNGTAERSEVIVVPFREGDGVGLSGMKLLCRCFGLFHQASYPPRGLHKGLLRFSLSGSQVILLSNLSPQFHALHYTSTSLTLP